MIVSEHGMSWSLGGFCQNNGQSILKNNISSGNWGKSYQRGEQWAIRGSGNLPLPVLIINIFLPVAVWSEIFNPKHLSLWCFYQICWTCFPSQPSFHYYPGVECFSGSLALLSGFLADSPPSLSRLYPSLLPLAGFRAWVCWRDEVVSLPSQPPFAVSIRKNVEELLSLNSSGISLISVQKDCEGSLSWSVFVPKFHDDQAVCLLIWKGFCSHLEHFSLDLEQHTAQGRLPPCPQSETSAVFWVFVARSKNSSGFPSPYITKVK